MIDYSTLGGVIMDSTCCDGYCGKCHAAKFIVVGIVLILVKWYTQWDIWVVLGVLLVLKGIMKLAMPTCSHCKPSMAMKKGK